jgi:hypothetical protein
MARDPDDSGRLVTVHLCTVNGVAMKFYRVETWLFRDGKLTMFRDGHWEHHPLERRHIGAYAVSLAGIAQKQSETIEKAARAWGVHYPECPIGCCS